MDNEYHGPIGLARSKYAPDERVKQVEDLVIKMPYLQEKVNFSSLLTNQQVAAAKNSPHILMPSIPVERETGVQKKPSEMPSPVEEASLTALAASEQPATVKHSPRALSGTKALQEEAVQQTLEVDHVLAGAVKNSHQILELLRTVIKKEDPTSGAGLHAIDKLWHELENLFIASEKAKDALPRHLEKQEENLGLMADSTIRDADMDTQLKLNSQHKKAHLQQELILEQQHYSQGAKNKADGKLEHVDSLKEQISSANSAYDQLRADFKQAEQESQQGNAVTEVIKKQLQSAETKIALLKNEVGEIVQLKNQAMAEREARDKIIASLNEQLNAQESQAKKRLDKEISRLDGTIKQQTEKVTELQAERNEGLSTAKKEVEKLRTELKTTQDKYDKQGAEFARSFKDLNEKTKKINSFEAVLKLMEEEKGGLSETVARLESTKERLQRQVDQLKSETDKAKEDKTLIGELTTKLKKAETEIEELEIENNDIVAKLAETKKLSAALDHANSEIVKLKAIVEELPSKSPSATEPGTAGTSALKELQQELDHLKAEKADWEKMARETYKEYQRVLPIYKEADAYRKENEKLRASHASGLKNVEGTDHDVNYWKAQYEAALERH